MSLDPFADERDPERIVGQFGFSAGADAKAVWSNSTGWSLHTTYTVRHTVRLPHGDLEWAITESSNKEAAIEEMQAFIKEARAALAKLKKARGPEGEA